MSSREELGPACGHQAERARTRQGWPSCQRSSATGPWRGSRGSDFSGPGFWQHLRWGGVWPGQNGGGNSRTSCCGHYRLQGSSQPVVISICFGFRTRGVCVCVCVCRSVHSLKREVNVHIWTEDHPVLSVTEMAWRRKWQLTPVFWPGKPHGQGSLAGYSPWGHKSKSQTWRSD